MDWSRAKTILIFIFLALNIFLIYNLVVEESKVVTIAQKDILDVQTILKRDNIILKANVPNRISPKSFLRVEDASYKESDLVKSLLGSSQGIKKTSENDAIVYKKGYLSLEIYPNKRIIFNNVPSDNVKGFSKNQIESYVENYLKMKGIFPQYAEKSRFYSDGDGYELDYKQVYHNNQIFQSYMNVKLSNKGVTTVDGLWFTPVGFMDEAKDIKTPIETLLVFAKDVDNKQQITVNDISLGYYMGDDFQNASVSAVPVWRIKSSDGFVYYYNAYEGYLEGKSTS